MTVIDREFSPSLFHPFYFIRTGLRDHFINNANSMSGRMMDFGCGSKPYRSLFQVDEYIGVDFNNEGHPHLNEQIDVFYDGKKIPFEDEYFDSVFSSEVFEHIFNPDEILMEVNRVMKHGGHFLMSCPFSWNEHEVPNDYARYTRFALKSMMEKNGFEVVSYSKSGNFITTIFQLFSLYWYTLYHAKPKRNVFMRVGYKLIVTFSNSIGVVMNKIFPTNDSLYLNNILLVRKGRSV